MICLALSTIFFQILLDLELWYVPFNDDVIYQVVLFSFVSKHLLLALSVMCLLWNQQW